MQIVEKSLRVNDFVQFIRERYAVLINKERGEPKPWTNDEILQRYRFCNVQRESDVVTKWIATNWREPLGMECNPDMWFWMLVARLVNHPDTLSNLDFQRSGWKWNEDRFIVRIENLQLAGSKAWGGAYIVSTNGRQMPKAQYIATEVLSPAWAARKTIQPHQHDTLRSFCNRLLQLNGVQGFIAGQVIADTKYGDEFLCEADDWFSFAVSGPGSKRGLNRVLGRDKSTPWNEREWLEVIGVLTLATNTATNKMKGRYAVPGLHAQDIQNCLCEFDKYERVRLGEGTPRSTYPGKR